MKGEIEIPNLSDENEVEEVDVSQVSFKDCNMQITLSLSPLLFLSPFLSPSLTTHQVVVTVENSTKDSSQVLKGMVHRMAPEVIRSKLQEYLRCLKEGV